MAADPKGLPPQTGPQEGRCGAVKTKDATGTPIRWCRKWPMRGQTRCEDDGGRSPQALAAAERRQQEAAAKVIVAKYGFPQHIEWHEAIQLGINESYGNLLAARDLVQRLAPEALTWGDSQVVTVGATQFPGIDVTKAAGIAPLVQLYGQERDRLHRQAVDAGKLGLEAQRNQIARDQAAAVIDFLTDTLRKLNTLLAAGEITSVDPADPAVARVVARGMRILAGVA